MTLDLPALIRDHGLPASYLDQVDTVLAPLASHVQKLRKGLGRTTVLGVCGAQGSGKSTLCDILASLLQAQGLSTAVLSLDDLYLPAQDRAALAAQVHPLFATRGVPGTHDVAQGESVLDALAGCGPVRLPRFDKAADAPLPEVSWPSVQAPVDVVLFEGWCVGAIAQDVAALAEPINALEQEEDRAGVWRGAVNAALATGYAHLFSRLDALVLLAAPDFDRVFAWRGLQERRLRAQRGAQTGMSDAELQRFIRHYERLTRHVLAEMPARADAVIPLHRDHTMGATVYRPGGRLTA